ncbi:MAG: DUF4112 domain-containing protein [Halobellus sp.]|uniref:DUF4112 domain-containing protein n=1 Tax=Halobellus sp. TaxID=1979212 RepID=UPI0035D48A12
MDRSDGSAALEGENASDNDRASPDATGTPTDGDGSGGADVISPSDLPSGADRARFARLRRLSHALDSAVAIPGTRIRIGLDPILGLLPVVGNAPTTAASAYVVAEAAALGAPRATLVRMCLNLLLDAAVGSIPLVGDAFDAVWRANNRNVRLLHARIDDPGGERRDRRAVAALGLVVFGLVLSVGAAAVVAVWWLFGLVSIV